MSDKAKGILRDYVSYIVIIIVVILVKVYVVTPIKVNGPSMNDTLKDKDIMLLDEISYRFSDIERFDIIVIKHNDEYIIKRIIGLPGETVAYKDNQLYINGKKVKENFSHKQTEDFDEVVVEEGTYFVLGDNRVSSVDSRIIGLVPKENIKGKATFVIYPFDRFGRKS